MSDAPQQAGPDLHAIFGMDGGPENSVEPVISVERGADTEEVAFEALSGEVPSVELEPAVGLDDRATASVEAATPSAEEEEGWKGITRPSRRGSSPRFLTDVIVDMGMASR
jgi:hypothetical protein